MIILIHELVFDHNIRILLNPQIFLSIESIRNITVTKLLNQSWPSFMSRSGTITIIQSHKWGKPIFITGASIGNRTEMVLSTVYFFDLVK